jgi:hypothetical protein
MFSQEKTRTDEVLEKGSELGWMKAYNAKKP